MDKWTITISITLSIHSKYNTAPVITSSNMVRIIWEKWISRWEEYHRAADPGLHVINHLRFHHPRSRVNPKVLWTRRTLGSQDPGDESLRALEWREREKWGASGDGTRVQYLSGATPWSTADTADTAESAEHKRCLVWGPGVLASAQILSSDNYGQQDHYDSQRTYTDRCCISDVMCPIWVIIQTFIRL